MESQRAFTAYKFQYISCYSLSVICRYQQYWIASFNTSHVTLYHCRLNKYEKYGGVSIHLMLLFIYNRRKRRCPEIRVSIHLMLLFILRKCIRAGWNLCFNTSHVTLYPIFSHISGICCTVSIHLMLLFIRSFQTICELAYGVSIHLMLLFIDTKKIIKICKGGFNTSHVTLYPNCWRTASVYHLVSIHLMLLFIVTRTTSWIS